MGNIVVVKNVTDPLFVYHVFLALEPRIFIFRTKKRPTTPRFGSDRKMISIAECGADPQYLLITKLREQAFAGISGGIKDVRPPRSRHPVAMSRTCSLFSTHA